MIVPLTLLDFVERAELVYGDREAVVDEPAPPGGGVRRRQTNAMASISTRAPPTSPAAWNVVRAGGSVGK